MKVITKEDLLKCTETERCRIIIKILNKEIIFKESDCCECCD